MKWRTLALLAVVGLPILSIGVTATPASAGIPHYRGPAPGAVTCSVQATITFSPAIGKPGGGSDPAKVKGTLGSCQTSDYLVFGPTIASAKLSGTFSHTPYLCARGCGATDASAALSVTWKGDYYAPHGEYGGTAHFTPSTVADTGSTAFISPAGDVGFYVPPVDHSSSVTGSFASNGSSLTLQTTDTPTQFAAAEASRAGLKRLTVTGNLTLRDTTAYVTNSFSNSVTPIDTSTNTPGSAIDVGNTPDAIAISPNGATAYVTNEDGNTVTPIDTFTDTPEPVIHVGSEPDAIAISPNGATAYVVNSGGDTVTPIATSTDTPGPVIDVGDTPSAIAITPNGATAYVANFFADTVTPINTSTNAAGTAIAVGPIPAAIAITPNGATAYVADGGTVTPIDTSTNAPGTAIDVGLNPVGIAITPNGATAYVTNYNSDSVTPINTSTDKPGSAIDAGRYPYGIAIMPDGATAYVTNYNDGTVTTIDTSTNTPGPVIDVGSLPDAVAIG